MTTQADLTAACFPLCSVDFTVECIVMVSMMSNEIDSVKIDSDI